MRWIKNNKNDDDNLKPGAVFEKYTVVKQLGRGGMGAVYLVRHNVLDSLFALKILSSDVASKNKEFVDRFIREAKLACKIRHPNLIAVHDAGQNSKSGQYYIVMDYVPGGSVRDLLKKTYRIPPEQALKIITQVADALTAACAHHMVHRDIKPDNIRFAADGSVKLADLGIAKSTDEQDTMITMADSVFGTPSYMSPEQARDSSKVDSRADIYSLGIVFYEMLTGHRPFSGSTAIQILSQVMDASSLPDIRQRCPETPPDLAVLISRMTEKNLEKRIQNPDILLQELKKIHIPPELLAKPLRLREEIGRGDSTSPAPVDVTMPTLDSVSSPSAAPSTEVTMPTVANVPAATAPEAPAPPAEPAPAPEVTMPTMANVTPATPAPAASEASSVTPAETMTAPAAPETAQTASPAAPEASPVTSSAETPATAAPAPAPEVTMATMAKAAPAGTPPAPEVTMATMAAPTVSSSATAAPRTAAETRSDSSPTSSSQPKSKKGILVISIIAAACFVLAAGGILAAMFLFGQETPAPKPQTDPAPADIPNSNTPSAGTLVITDTTNRDTNEAVTPGGAAAVIVSRNKEQTPSEVQPGPAAPSVDTPSVPEEMTSDPLGKKQIVLLADTSAVSRKTKDILSEAFGADNVSFQEAEGMGSYRQLLSRIVKSEPSIVVLCFALQYAEDGVSASGYENVIGYHADQFQEQGIPFLFVQPEDDDGERLRPYLDATLDICRLRSVPFINAADLTRETLVSQIRDNQRSE